MDDSNFSETSSSRHTASLSVNKMGKTIRKIPLHQPNLGKQQQPKPQVYNISKNDFRNVVQQLTGSPSQHDSFLPPHNPPKTPSSRLQRIRPHSLTSTARSIPTSLLNNNLPDRPGLTPGNSLWANTAESPVPAYMSNLQSSIDDSGPRPASSRPTYLLPSLTSELVSPSPSGFLNLMPPQFISPGFQHQPHSTPDYSISPLSPASAIVGSGPLTPLSAGVLFPSPPPGFLLHHDS